MQTQPIDDTDIAARGSEKPGEFSHYYLNLLALFGRERHVDEIAWLARRAVACRLIEVESARVGRDLVKGLREGRVGLIYVDGNMGPDGHKVEEGGVDVDFVGRRIRVKEGIARLSHSLRMPVLPLLVEPQKNA